MTPALRLFSDPVLLGRYLDGSALPAERAVVERWVGADPERRAALEAPRAAWVVEAEQLGAPYDADRAWASFTRRRSPSRSRWKVHGLAAGIVIAVLGAGGAWWLSRTSRPVAEAPEIGRASCRERVVVAVVGGVL